MTPSRPAVIVALALAAGAVTWIVLLGAYPTSQQLPWSAMPTLLLLALGEAVTALGTRARIQRKKGTKPIEPLVVARLAALAKASAHAAGVVIGVFGGFALHLVSSLDKPGLRHDFYVSCGTFLAGGALLAAALFLEYVCRVPKPPDNAEAPPIQ